MNPLLALTTLLCVQGAPDEAAARAARVAEPIILDGRLDDPATSRRSKSTPSR